jgi:REP element-mobilizing transposase RayT
MAETYASLYIHLVFSTKDRQPTLRADLRERVWRYLGGIARKEEMKAIEIGGAADHIHALLSLAPTMAPATVAQALKGNSSKWINETLGLPCRFEWQEGYGAFSVGVSQIDRTVEYIRNQERHHRKKSFQEEYLGFLKKHKIEYDERYIWS